MKRSTPRRLGPVAMAVGATLSLITGGVVFGALPASATGGPSLSLNGISPYLTATTLPEEHWVSTTYGNGEFVAVGAAGNVAYSSNGSAWSSATLPVDDSWTSVTYGGGTFVAVSLDGGIAFSTNGSSWAMASSPIDAPWESVAYGNDEFVAVSDNGDAAFSADGGNWTAAAMSFDEAWNAVTYGDGEFVAVATNFAEYSTDGSNWTAVVLPGDANPMTSVAYGNGEFVALDNDGSAAVSTNGESWTLESNVLPGNAGSVSVTYGDGLFVAGSQNSTDLAYSPDGVTWTPITTELADSSWAIAYGGGEFVAASYTSSDAEVLTFAPLGAGTGNTYTATLDTGETTGAVTPPGLVAVDDGTNSCSASDWTPITLDNGDEGYTATCSIPNDEPYNTSVTASYDDTGTYGEQISNSLNVGEADESATIASVSITGTPQVGDTLTATPSGVSGTPAPATAYQWYDDGSSPITGATSNTYTVHSSDIGDTISVVATESNGVGFTASATTAADETVAALSATLALERHRVADL